MSFGRLFLALLGIGLLVFPLVAFLGPFALPGFFLIPIAGVWIFDSMIQLRWMHQRELAMALGVAMRRKVPLLPVLEGNPLAARPPWWKRFLSWFFPYPFYAPLYAWKFGARAVLLRAIERAKAGDPEAIQEPGLLHSDDLLDMEMDRLVPGLDPGRTRGGRLRSELARSSSQAVYPILIILFTFYIATFWLQYIAPKMIRISMEFGIPLPWLTEMLQEWIPWVAPILFRLIGLAILACGLCWYFPALAWRIPGVAGLVAPWGRGRLLESLGQLVRSGRPLPEALELLDKPPLHGREARRRLGAFRLGIEEGTPANEAMRRSGLINSAQEAWLGLATRSGRFGDALVELGGSLQALSLRRLRWRSTLAGTIGILMVGILVGFVVVAIFIPLVDLMEWLGG